MNKKIVPLICLSLILCFCVPSVPALADETLIPGYYTKDSIDGLFTGYFNGVDRSTVADLIYNSENDSFDYLDLLQTIDFTSYNNYSFFVYSPNSGSVNFQVVLIENMAGNNLPLVYYKNGYYGLVYPRIAPYNNTVHLFSRSNDGTIVHTTTTASRVDPYLYGLFPVSGSPSGSRLLYAYNIYGVYAAQELNTVVPSYSEDFVSLANDVYGSNTNGYTNYWYDTMPYYDGDSVVDPDAPAGESNLNHLYFNSCEIGFCEPYGATNFSTFGGAYFYVKYQVDDWIMEHLNEYDIYFSATGYVGSRQYNGSKRVSLDQDGCITIPFSDIFTTDGGVVSNGFVSAVSSKVVDRRFYKTYLYSIAGEKLQNFIDKQNNVGGSFSSAWDDLVHTVKETYFFVYNGGNGFSEVIQDVVQSQIESLSTVYKNYKINTNVYLVDSNDNRSGNVGRLFDLYQGSDTSTDNQGLENENPFTDDTEDYLPDLPDDEQIIETSNNTNGVNIYNMTPSQIKLTIDNGLKEFVTWYNSDPSVGNTAHSFWNNMGIFKDNPAASIYQQYFGFLPADFKDLIFGACGIGIVGGAFCILRKKLT